MSLLARRSTSLESGGVRGDALPLRSAVFDFMRAIAVAPRVAPRVVHARFCRLSACEILAGVDFCTSDAKNAEDRVWRHS